MHVLLAADQSASADRSIAHNLAYKSIGLTEKSMQNMQTGLQKHQTGLQKHQTGLVTRVRAGGTLQHQTGLQSTFYRRLLR